MKFFVLPILFTLAASLPLKTDPEVFETGVNATCVLPIPHSSNISTPFAIQVLYPDNLIIHERRMNFWSAGGGDQHLYLEPAGASINNLTLVNGVITASLNDGPIIRAVINGEYTARDNTTKIFVTRRGDPRAGFNVQYTCDIYDPSLVHTELKLSSGDVCVRLASGGRYEFRSSPFGNTATDMVKCFKVTLRLLFS